MHITRTRILHRLIPRTHHGCRTGRRPPLSVVNKRVKPLQLSMLRPQQSVVTSEIGPDPINVVESSFLGSELSTERSGDASRPTGGCIMTGMVPAPSSCTCCAQAPCLLAKVLLTEGSASSALHWTQIYWYTRHPYIPCSASVFMQKMV